MPAAIVLQVSGAFIGELGSHGLKISQVTQLLLIVLILGAGTDYGLFLVFRVREGHPIGPARRTTPWPTPSSRVGESISASAGTVILGAVDAVVRELRHLSRPRRAARDRDRRDARRRLTLLPALLAILGRVVFWPARIVPGELEGEPGGERWRSGSSPDPSVPSRSASSSSASLALGSLFYTPAGFGGDLTAPSGSDAAAGNAALAKYFPQASSNPTNLILRLVGARLAGPRGGRHGREAAAGERPVHRLVRPLDPAGAPIPPATYVQLHRTLGDPEAARAAAAGRFARREGADALYDSYRATARFVSPDGQTIQFEAGLTAGDAGSTPALNAVPTSARP